MRSQGGLPMTASKPPSGRKFCQRRQTPGKASLPVQKPFAVGDAPRLGPGGPRIAARCRPGQPRGSVACVRPAGQQVEGGVGLSAQRLGTQQGPVQRGLLRARCFRRGKAWVGPAARFGRGRSSTAAQLRGGLQPDGAQTEPGQTAEDLASRRRSADSSASNSVWDWWTSVTSAASAVRVHDGAAGAEALSTNRGVSKSSQVRPGVSDSSGPGANRRSAGGGPGTRGARRR